MQYKQHPLSAAFPGMDGADYAALKDGIEDIGVQNPMTIYEGQVLDGWHRYTAANELGITCPFVELSPNVDPRDFVKNQNLNRRHLTASQRAAAVVACSEWAPAHRPMLSNKVAAAAPLSKTNEEFNKVAATATLLKTNEEMAKEAGVKIRTIIYAKAAEKAGLLGAVRDGALTAEEAGKIVRGTPDKPLKAPSKAAEKPEADYGAPVDYTPLDEANDRIQGLQELATELTDRLAVSAMDATPDEKAMAAETIDGLRKENQQLQANYAAVVRARDQYMDEVRELKKQCDWYKRQLDKQKS